MSRVIAYLGIIVGFCLAPSLGAQEAVKATEDCCTIPMSLFAPSFKKAIENETPADSKIRKAALEALSGKLLKGTAKLFPKDGGVSKGMSETNFKIEPASGEAVIDGTTWEWKITAVLGEVGISNKASPAFARFRWHPRFTIETKNRLEKPWIIQVSSDDTEEKWFYIVAGAGKEQDGTKAPKHAPDPGKK